MLVKITDHQPDLLPWAGFWHKAVSVDLFVLALGLPFSYGSYTNRVKIGGSFLTIPIENVGLNTPVIDVQISEQFRADRCIRRLQQTLGSKKQPYRERLEPVLQALSHMSKYRWLAELNLALMTAMETALQIQVPWVIDFSETDLTLPKHKRLSRRLSAFSDREFVYLAGSGAREYLLRPWTPPMAGVWFQKVSDQVPDGSMLELMVRVADPISELKQWISWDEDSD